MYIIIKWKSVVTLNPFYYTYSHLQILIVGNLLCTILRSLKNRAQIYGKKEQVESPNSTKLLHNIPFV